MSGYIASSHAELHTSVVLLSLSLGGLSGRGNGLGLVIGAGLLLDTPLAYRPAKIHVSTSRNNEIIVNSNTSCGDFLSRPGTGAVRVLRGGPRLTAGVDSGSLGVRDSVNSGASSAEGDMARLIMAKREKRK